MQGASTGHRDLSYAFVGSSSPGPSLTSSQGPLVTMMVGTGVLIPRWMPTLSLANLHKHGGIWYHVCTQAGRPKPASCRSDTHALVAGSTRFGGNADGARRRPGQSLSVGRRPVLSRISAQ